MTVRVWYAGGSIYEGEIERAPKTGVLVVRIVAPDGKVRRVFGRDYYYTHTDGMVYATDSSHAALDYALKGETVLKGQQVSYEEWIAMYDVAMHD